MPWGGLVWFWMGVALATCTRDSAGEIVGIVEQLESAFDAVDDARFEANYKALHDAVPCIRSPLSRAAMVAWHRARALGEFFEREELASAKSWAAVKVLDPSYAPPERWMPGGSPLREAWDTAPMGAATITLARVPAGGWMVDGQPTNGVPAERAFILQGFDASHQIVHTDYHYSIAEVPVVDFVRLDPTAAERRRRRVRLGGTAIGIALGGSALAAWGVASLERQAALAAGTPAGDRESHARRANATSATALGLGLGATFVVGGSWIIRW